MGAKLGREVREWHEKHLAKTKFWNSKRLPWKSGNSAMAQVLARWCWNFHGEIYFTIVICLQKMNEIYQAVPEIGHSNYHGNSLRLVSAVTRSMTSCAHVTSTLLWRQTDWRRSPERAKFWIFQIGPLLAEIRPILWRRVCSHCAQWSNPWISMPDGVFHPHTPG